MAVIPAWFECLIGMSGTMQLRPSSRLFDASRLKREFPGLTDPQLHYLDNAATAQMPEVVLSALRRFEVDARANVHEGMHARARAATDAYHQARASIARFLNANTDQEVVFTYGTTSSINFAAYGAGIEEVYQRQDLGGPPGWQNEFETIRIRLTDFTHAGTGTGAGWQNEFETIRIRLADFKSDGRTLDLTNITKVRFLFGSSQGSSQGALGIDDIEWTKK